MKTPPQPPSDLLHSLLLLPTLYRIHPHIYPSLPQQHLHIQAYMCLYVALNHRRTRLLYGYTVYCVNRIARLTCRCVELSCVILLDFN